MRDQNILLTERARGLLLAFAISHNASDFCRFITVVALRDFRAASAVMVRLETDESLRSVGAYGQLRPEDSDGAREKLQLQYLNKAIIEKRLIEIEHLDGSAEQSFISIPFSPNGEVIGALGVTFKNKPQGPSIPKAEVELLQLLSELIAVNSLPRMRSSSFLSKLYFDESSGGGLSDITDRQLQVLDEMAIGKTNSQIARSLNLSESTIKQEAVRLFKILGVNTRQRAVSVGKEMGII